MRTACLDHTLICEPRHRGGKVLSKEYMKDGGKWEDGEGQAGKRALGMTWALGTQMPSFPGEPDRLTQVRNMRTMLAAIYRI